MTKELQDRLIKLGFIHQDASDSFHLDLTAPNTGREYMLSVFEMIGIDKVVVCFETSKDGDHNEVTSSLMEMAEFLERI